MAIGDVTRVPGTADLHCIDTGMYGVSDYGSVFVHSTDRSALIDTGIGTDLERILDGLVTLGIRPADLDLIVPTHVHLDHAGGAGRLARECPTAEVLVHEIGAPHLAAPDRLWEGTKRAVGPQIEHYAEPVPVPEERLTALTDGDTVDLGNRSLAVHHCPGHAPHQIVLFDPSDGILFTADAAGIYVQSRDEIHPTSPPPNFDLEGCLADIETQQALDPEVLCYGHFGATPAGDKLHRYREVIETWVADIAAMRGDHADEVVVQHFVSETDLDEVWGAAKAEPETGMNVRGVLRYLDERAA